MKYEINANNDLTVLGTSCYICNQAGHLSVDCLEFQSIKGNIKRTSDK